jgi:beta-lactamase regulating signal transducer with metallopeptidase domain
MPRSFTVGYEHFKAHLRIFNRSVYTIQYVCALATLAASPSPAPTATPTQEAAPTPSQSPTQTSPLSPSPSSPAEEPISTMYVAIGIIGAFAAIVVVVVLLRMRK